jgi:purine-nucleoside phosphorylase
MIALAAVEAELGDLPGEAVGIGGVLAAIGATRAILARRPDAVVLVGSAGAYPGGPAVGAVIAARRVGLLSAAAVAGLGYVPVPPPPIDGDPGLLARLGLPLADVACTDAITTDPIVAAALGATWQVEHLEAFSVARACLEAKIPFAAVLGIANSVGPHAHSQWLAHRSAAEDAARRAVRALVA